MSPLGFCEASGPGCVFNPWKRLKVEEGFYLLIRTDIFPYVTREHAPIFVTFSKMRNAICAT